MTELHRTTVGSGPPVVLLHGMGDDSSVWDETVAELAGDFACTAVDLPGHGRSPAPDDPAAYEREAVLDAIDEVLERTGSALLVGHSLGGYLALAHRITRRDGSATGPDDAQQVTGSRHQTTGPAAAGSDDAQQVTGSRHRITGPAAPGLVLVSAGPGFRDADSMAQWNDRVRANAPSLSMAAAAAAIGFHVDSMVIDRLEEVTVPVGLVVGSEDRNFRGANDYMEARLADVRRTTVEGGRHRVMLTHPGEVATMAREVAAAAGLLASTP